MESEIIVRVTHAYGATIYYPVCDTAKKFALIAGTKTLTRETCRIIKDMGYEIRIKHEEIDI